DNGVHDLGTTSGWPVDHAKHAARCGDAVERESTAAHKFSSAPNAAAKRFFGVIPRVHSVYCYDGSTTNFDEFLSSFKEWREQCVSSAAEKNSSRPSAPWSARCRRATWTIL